MSKFNIGLKL